jgi:hypothetical protein
MIDSNGYESYDATDRAPLRDPDDSRLVHRAGLLGTVAIVNREAIVELLALGAPFDMRDSLTADPPRVR